MFPHSYMALRVQLTESILRNIAYQSVIFVSDNLIDLQMYRERPVLSDESIRQLIIWNFSVILLLLPTMNRQYWWNVLRYILL